LKSLSRKGIIGSSPSLDDVLGLVVENLLERRLQSIVMSKGLVPSAHAARQAVTHGHVMVDNRRVTIPGFIVLLNMEPTVRLVEGSTLAKLMIETPTPVPPSTPEKS
jgi:small subunit ribosomal protein S4